MPHRPYMLTPRDKDLLEALVLDLATELDLHYLDEDVRTLSGSFAVIKDAIALLERFGSRPHGDVQKIIARYNRHQQ